jgi:hypothetical protein
MGITKRADGALVVQTANERFTIDLRQRTIEASFADGVRVTLPLATVERIRISPALVKLWLDLPGRRVIEIDQLASQEIALRIARPIALLTRCAIEFEVTESRPLAARPPVMPFARDPDPTLSDPLVPTTEVHVDEDATELEDPRLVLRAIPAELVDEASIVPDDEDATEIEIEASPAWLDESVWAGGFSLTDEIRITPRPASPGPRSSAADRGRRTRWPRFGWLTGSKRS